MKLNHVVFSLLISVMAQGPLALADGRVSNSGDSNQDRFSPISNVEEEVTNSNSYVSQFFTEIKCMNSGGIPITGTYKKIKTERRDREYTSYTQVAGLSIPTTRRIRIADETFSIGCGKRLMIDYRKSKEVEECVELMKESETISGYDLKKLENAMRSACSYALEKDNTSDLQECVRLSLEHIDWGGNNLVNACNLENLKGTLDEFLAIFPGSFAELKKEKYFSDHYSNYLERNHRNETKGDYQPNYKRKRTQSYNNSSSENFKL